MSIYRFAAMPSYGTGETPFVTWNEAFNDEEVERIHQNAADRKSEEAFVGDGEKEKAIRVSEVTWLEHANDTDWLYDTLAFITNQLNGQFYKFDLFGFQEHMQYTVYDSEKEGHYTWHVDGGVKTASVRKLSIVVQLSDPSEYEGGDLEILVGSEPIKIDRKKGLIAAFPSYVLHRVTPVTKGIRKSLVIWVTGPSFK